MCISDAKALFESDAFKGWQKWREQDQKLKLATIERLDGVIKSLHALGKRR